LLFCYNTTMTRLKAELRDPHIKVYKIRRIGYIPAIVYGGKEKASICIQIDALRSMQMLSHTNLGDPIELLLDKTTYHTILKEVSLDPLTNRLLHMDFQISG